MDEYKIDLSKKAEEVTPQVEETQAEAPAQEEPKKEVPTNDDGDFVINLNPEKDAVQQVQGEAEESVLRDESVVEEDEQTLELIEEEKTEEVTTEAEPEVKVVNEEAPLEEVTEEPTTKTVIDDPSPEGLDKFVAFMNDTGLEGTAAMQAYVNLNKNPEEMDARTLLTEYYKSTKPFLNDDQIQKQLNKKYAYEEGSISPEEAEERNIALQEDLYNAKQHFVNYKDKYYADLKLRQQTSLPADAQEAVTFYGEYKQKQESQAQATETIKKQIDQVFNEDFKGFDFKVGEAKYRYKVNDVAKQKETNKDFLKVFGRFFGDDGSLTDAYGYNKALTAAQDVDKLAKHFYDQGRADAVKESAIKAKNIDMDARQDKSAVVTPSGQTVKVVSGNSKSTFKPKMTIKGWNDN